MDACYQGGEYDKVGAPGTGRALHYVNSWAMSFPSDGLTILQTEKLITGVSPVKVTLNVDESAVLHQIGMSAINP